MGTKLPERGVAEGAWSENRGLSVLSPVTRLAEGAEKVEVKLHGGYVGTMSFDGQANSASTFDVPNSELLEGANTLVLSVAARKVHRRGAEGAEKTGARP